MKGVADRGNYLLYPSPPGGLSAIPIKQQEVK